MNTYLLVKTLHILSSVLLVGTGFGSAFYLFFTNRRGPIEAIATTARLVIRADFWFTTPAAIFQPISGLWLASQAGWPLDSSWILLSFALYFFTGLCWLPVLWLQWQMALMAENSVRQGSSLPSRYWTFARLWESLGYPAFIAMLATYFLMVLKPVF